MDMTGSPVESRLEDAMTSAIALVLPLSLLLAAAAPAAAQTAPASFYDITVKALDGTPGNLAQYKGTVTLVVNVASQCAYTPQYAGLEKLYREMKGKGVTVLGFPSNDFGGQEPGSAAEIQRFCKLNYDVSFPMFEKLVTRRGPEQSPVYAYLGRSGNLPQWNFAKYVIDRQAR
jgi:glutathione peroxidase